MRLLRTIGAALTAALLMLLFTPAHTFASAPPPVTVDANDVSTVVIAAPVVTIIVSLLIPVINGFLTKPATPAGVKAIGTIILNAIWALIASGVMTDGTAVFSSTTLYTALLGCVISIVSYAGVYKPMGVTSNAGGKLATVGVT